MECIGPHWNTADASSTLSVGVVSYCDIYLMCLEQTLGDQR